MKIIKVGLVKEPADFILNSIRDLAKNNENLRNSYSIESINCFEHPHGGLIAVFLVKIVYINQDSKKRILHSIYLSRYAFSSDTTQEEIWSQTGKIHDIEHDDQTEVEDEISLASFINLQGNLQIFYSVKNKLISLESTNYGKSFSEPDVVFESFHPFRLSNQILISEKGFILIAAQKLENQIPFVLISEDLGHNWSVSTLIEPYNYEEMLDEGISIKTIAQSLIPLGESTLEDLLLYEFAPISKNNNKIKRTLFNSRSVHSGYTWSEATPFFENKDELDKDSVSAETVPALLIKGIRVLDESKNYAPKILLTEFRSMGELAIKLMLIPINEIGIDNSNYKTKIFYTNDIITHQSDLERISLIFSKEISQNQITVIQSSEKEFHMLIYNPLSTALTPEDKVDVGQTNRGNIIHLIFEI